MSTNKAKQAYEAALYHGKPITESDVKSSALYTRLYEENIKPAISSPSTVCVENALNDATGAPKIGAAPLKAPGKHLTRRALKTANNNLYNDAISYVEDALDFHPSFMTSAEHAKIKGSGELIKKTLTNYLSNVDSSTSKKIINDISKIETGTDILSYLYAHAL